ncbi:hypothetical protein EG329_010838 [Mollisiaceae sp. DMI_Dod_QoI]|nr:hypothetical protein EG329_010838 [Helotiales sp. DMI_Dod_QoI]
MGKPPRRPEPKLRSTSLTSLTSSRAAIRQTNTNDLRRQFTALSASRGHRDTVQQRITIRVGDGHAEDAEDAEAEAAVDGYEAGSVAVGLCFKRVALPVPSLMPVLVLRAASCRQFSTTAPTIRRRCMQFRDGPAVSGLWPQSSMACPSRRHFSLMDHGSWIMGYAAGWPRRLAPGPPSRTKKDVEDALFSAPTNDGRPPVNA